MDGRAIGVFDSGLGGLCAVCELEKLLPHEKLIYFGDTGRVPYGTKSAETIKKYASQDVRFLLSHNVKAVLAACGTVSSVALDILRRQFDVPVFGVIDGAAEAAYSASKNKKIAVIGTEATITAGVFEKRPKDKGAETIGIACPLFVPLVECGFTSDDCKITELACEQYLGAVKDFGADTLILGCTHFPIIAGAIGKYLPGVALINPAKEAANLLSEELLLRDMLSREGEATQYYVSDEPKRFDTVAKIFIGRKISAERVDIEKY